MFEYDIFLSHSRDDKLLARLARGYLRSHNLEAWFDDKDFRPPEDYTEKNIENELLSQIDRCENFVVFTSQNSIKSRWVRKEVERAQALLREGTIQRVFGLIVDDTPRDELPDWLSTIRHLEVGGVFQKIDMLKSFREEIGEKNPTYISDVEPNFLKQITMDRLGSNIQKCTPGHIKIWFIDGGHSFENYIIPGLESLLEAHSDAKVTCTVMLHDSVYLPGAPSSLLGGKRHTQDAFDAHIRKSYLLTRTEPHHDMVQESFQLFSEFQRKYPNIECEFFLTERMPAGRFIFIGDVGFFGPCLSSDNVQLPMFVFDKKSPFFVKATRHYEEAVGEARRWS